MVLLKVQKCVHSSLPPKVYKWVHRWVHSSLPPKVYKWVHRRAILKEYKVKAKDKNIKINQGAMINIRIND